jgi:Flp pilus assembly pilin Flp
MLKLYFAARNRLDAAKDFLTKKEEGASLVEYALLVGLIAVACAAAITTFGNLVKTALYQAAVGAGV